MKDIEKEWSKPQLIDVLLRYLLCSFMLLGGTTLLALMAFSKIFWLGLTFTIMGSAAFLFITTLLIRGLIKKDLSPML